MLKFVSDLKIQEPFDGLFNIKKKTLSGIMGSISEKGFDEACPVVLWKDTNIVVDGITRCKAAVELRLQEVPTIEKEFADQAEALEYAIGCQRNRRNITDGELLKCIEVLDTQYKRGKKASGDANKDTNGKSSEKTAEAVGTSTRKVEKARTVLNKADEQTKQDVLDNKKSINKAYNEVQDKEKKKNGLDLQQQPKQEKVVEDKTITSKKAELVDKYFTLIEGLAAVFSDAYEIITDQGFTSLNERYETVYDILESNKDMLWEGNDAFKEMLKEIE